MIMVSIELVPYFEIGLVEHERLCNNYGIFSNKTTVEVHKSFISINDPLSNSISTADLL